MDMYGCLVSFFFFFSSRRRHTRLQGDWSSDVCSSDLQGGSKQLAWSDAGQLLSYTDCSGHSTHYHYDRWGALIEVDNALGQRQRHQRDGQGRIVASELPNGQIEDRKSTRLNSSHLVISYAVFCLKKKT